MKSNKKSLRAVYRALVIAIGIVGSHDDYYKILTPHEQIGWVKKDEVK